MIEIDEATHEVFKKTLIKSQQAVMHMAELLEENMDMEVHVEGLKVAPTFDVRQNFKDKGDLWGRKTVGPWRRYEVRWFMRSAHHFTCRADFPHPRIIVYPANSWNYMVKYNHPLPARVFYFNNDRSAFAVVNPLKTKDKWIRQTTRNRRYDGWQDNYMLDIEHVESWWTVEPWQKIWPVT